jgi:proton-translocating NADH-quinone oxidoreductase chain N
MLSLFPEIIVCCGALLVAILGAALTRPQAASRLGWVSLAVCFIALLSLPVTRHLSPATSLPSWLNLALSFDAFALFFRFFALSAAIIVILSSFDYLRAKALSHPGEFYGLLLFAVLGVMLLGAAIDLITIILSLELLSASCYILTAFLKRDERSAEGGLKYFLVGAISTAIMLYGLSLLFGLTGSTSLAGIAQGLSAGVGAAPILAVVLTLVGFAFKVALVPFHTWSPDAYEGAPTPITAFLSVGPKAAGFAVLVRVFLTSFSPDLASWPSVAAALSIITMTVGNLLAIPQTNIKRMLAYSSISQAGYLLIGVVCAAPWAGSAITSFGVLHAAKSSTLTAYAPFGIQALLLYLTAYLFMNLGAFLVVIAVSHKNGNDEIPGYVGLMQTSPFLALSLTVFFLSLAGVPPTGGFVGKLYLFAAAIGSGLWWLALVGVLNSVVSLYYYFNVVRNMFFLQPAASATSCKPKVSSLSFAIAVCLALTFLIALMPERFISFARFCAFGLGH